MILAISFPCLLISAIGVPGMFHLNFVFAKEKKKDFVCDGWIEGTLYNNVLYSVFLFCCLRFSYTRYDKKHGAIYQSIEALDKMGMDIIESGDPDAFKAYLSETDNTICGRHPISVFLHVRTSTFSYVLYVQIASILLNLTVLMFWIFVDGEELSNQV